MGRMRYPALSLHGIEGDAGSRTVIPAKVSGKFSIRYVRFTAAYRYDSILISIRTASSRRKRRRRCTR